MQNFFSRWKKDILTENAVYLPMGDHLNNFVNAYDVGEITFISMTENHVELNNNTFEITGQAFLRMSGIA